MMIRNLGFILLLGGISTAFGTTLGSGTTCPVASLSTYVAFGSAGCSVNGVLFNNFAFLYGFSNGSTPMPTAAQIVLSPGSAAGASFGFTYPVITSNLVTFAVQYDFDPVPVVADTGITLDVVGDVDVFQTLCPGGTFQPVPKGCYGRPGDTAPVNLEVYNAHLGLTKLTDSAPVVPPVTNGEIQLYFTLNGHIGMPAGFDRLSSSIEAGTATPEPNTFVFLAGGLLLAAIRVGSARRRTSN